MQGVWSGWPSSESGSSSWGEGVAVSNVRERVREDVGRCKAKAMRGVREERGESK